MSSRGGSKAAGAATAAPGPKTFAPEPVAFATLRPTFSDCSAQLVELMRATLRQAQEIGAAVGEAEETAERAREVVDDAEAAVTSEERRIADMEIKRLQSGMPGSRQAGAQARDREEGGESSVSFSSNDQPSSFSSPSRRPKFARSFTTKWMAQRPGTTTTLLEQQDIIAAPNPISAQMNAEIETTVMWVQQLLESVHFIESDTALEPGASLLSKVQPRLRHQKDDALHQSLLLFHEKKESEKDVDELAAFFRRQALQAVAARTPSSPP